MSDFICKNDSNVIIGQWQKITPVDDYVRCAQLIREDLKKESIKLPKRKSSEPVLLTGTYEDGIKQIIATAKSAPENVQIISADVFADRYAHEIVSKSWAQRADFVYNAGKELDVDDLAKLQQNLTRDLSASIRALVGDVLDLQARLGELMLRVDNLEMHRLIDNTNPHDLPDRDLEPNPSAPNLPEIPYYIGNTAILTQTDRVTYHQGGTCTGGMRRYWNAQRAANIVDPGLNPYHNYFGQQRFSQSNLSGDGYKYCGKNLKRCNTQCISKESVCEQSTSLNVAKPLIPAYITPFYVPKTYSSGQALIGQGLMDGVKAQSGWTLDGEKHYAVALGQNCIAPEYNNNASVPFITNLPGPCS